MNEVDGGQDWLVRYILGLSWREREREFGTMEGRLWTRGGRRKVKGGERKGSQGEEVKGGKGSC